jgi:hypothetical protein
MTFLTAMLGAVIAFQAAADSTGAPARAVPDSAGSITAEDAILRGRELIGDADYDRSIEVLRAALAKPGLTTTQRRDIYLLLVNTYVFLGNDLKFKPQGREASNLNYQEARRLIAEMLRVRELRHTQPDPLSPPEVVTAFAEVRRQIFGAFRILEITPPTAHALLDGDTLRAFGEGDQRGDTNIEVGPHVVMVEAEGYKPVEDRITIVPGVTLERSYQLVRRRSPWYYAARWAGGLGLAGGIAILASGRGGGGGGETLAPLPEAPGPPPTSR